MLSANQAYLASIQPQIANQAAGTKHTGHWSSFVLITNTESILNIHKS